MGGHVARTGEKRRVLKFLERKTEGKNHKEDLETNKRVILKCVLNGDNDVNCLRGSGWGPVASSWEHGNESSEFTMLLALATFSRTSLQGVSIMLETTNVIKNYDYVQIQLLYHVSKHLYNLYLSIAILKYRNPGSDKGFPYL
jgi:hypothetical protein